MKKALLIGSALGLFGLGLQQAAADSFDGTLYYTTFSGGTNVHSVDYSYVVGTSFALTNNTGLASTSGADGLLFAPNGNLLVAGQGNNLTEVTTTGTIVKNVAPGAGLQHGQRLLWHIGRNPDRRRARWKRRGLFHFRHRQS